jgi:hypothetical protein
MPEPVSVQSAPRGALDPVNASEIAAGYGDDAAPDTLESAAAELDVRALNGLRLTAAREAAERALADAQAAEREELEHRIPELLERMRMKKCTTLSGVEIVLKDEIKAAMPGRERVADRLALLAWLVDNGHGGVIKNAITVELDRGEDTRADELLTRLRADGFEASADKVVHPGTLSSLAKELIEAGKVVPTDIMNLHNVKKARLVRK